jgi:arginyl-tRNA--protein-N-Asp/Glu arginylyltransferase
METLFSYVAPPSQCGYLPEQTWSLQYDIVATTTADEYMDRMRAGWRRFGRALFRPRCQVCQACQPLRVVVNQFRPDRSQRRAAKLNEGTVELRIREPVCSPAKLQLYDRYHAFQADAKGWPQHPAKDPQSYISSFVDNPFRTEEWCYFIGRKLVGVGYVDDLYAGLSGIYFFYDPDWRHLSLGTWNVLNLLRVAAERRVPHLYLGYYVAGCPSMLYKARFQPNQILGPDGQWRNFLPGSP